MDKAEGTDKRGGRMKEISLEDAIRVVVEVGRGMSREANNSEEVSLIAEVGASIIRALMDLPTTNIEMNEAVE